MRAALARVRDTDEVGLAVGSEEVSLSRSGDSVVERKVALPVRWLKGFVEVQAYQARMARKLEVSGFEAARFFRSLPKGSATTSGWVVASGRGLRLSQVAASGGVRVGGVQRLHILDDLARHAQALRIYADERNQASAWELVLDEARFTLALSPDVSRGFSGEGQVLTDLAAHRWEDTLPRVQASLKWGTRIEPDALAAACAFDRETVTAALGVLGARGLVGYDLAEGAYFHRELPFDLEKVDTLQPRLLDARKLVGSGGVRIERNDATTGQVEAAVRGTEGGLKAILLDDPGLLEHEIWRIFETEPGPRAIQLITAGMQGVRPEATWEVALTELANEGRISRDRLLDACLDGLSRDLHDQRARWFAALHDQLEPAPEEMAARDARYLDFLGSRNPSTVAFALKVFKDLMKLGRVDPGVLVDRLAPALNSRTKGTVKQALPVVSRGPSAGWRGRVLRRTVALASE